jgi:hypothetical protein
MFTIDKNRVSDVVLIVAVIDVEVLDAQVHQLGLGALVLIVRSAAMVAFNVLLRTARRAALALNEGQSLTIRITHTLQPWWGYIVGEHAHGLNHRLWIVVSSLRHVVRQVHLELVVLAVVGSAEQHAREVALAAYFFGFDDCCAICGGDVFRLHSLRNELRCHQSWFATVSTSVRLDHTNQGLEVLPILCVGHGVGLVVGRNSMLSLLESVRALLVVVKMATVPSND